MLRGRWIKGYKPTFHQPEDYMPDFMKPKQVVSLDEARQAAAVAAKTAKASSKPPPAVLQKKWETLVAMRTARAKANKRKQA